MPEDLKRVGHLFQTGTKRRREDLMNYSGQKTSRGN